MTDIKSMLPSELEALIVSLDEPKFRAKQIFSWLAKGVRNFGEMKNLPKSLKEKLDNVAYVSSLKLLDKRESLTDGTVKYLWSLKDENAIETVLMRYDYGSTVCISSQVGCRQGCAFCASAIGGLVRNLESSEMLDEVIFTALESGEKISRIVIMGIGEPLDNYDNVVQFLRLVNHPYGLNIGMRHISLSTCGIPSQMDALAQLDLQITLAVSLHSADDEVRSRLMPASRRAGVSELISACERYFKKTGRRITFEYAMIDGVNDTMAQAKALAKAAKRVSAHINLIPLNHVPERSFAPSGDSSISSFCKVLEDMGANFTLRRSLGGDVDASCGQLRRSSLGKSTEQI